VETYISLLRGINVSGQKKILMADLKALYESLGFSNVKTYIQSGNVVFNFEKTTAVKLQQLIFDQIQSKYDFEVPILILNSTEIEVALAENPYPNIEKPYFTFLSELPLEETINELNKFSFDNEFYELKGKVIYSHYPNGAVKAKLTTTFFEKKLKVTATARNLNTTKKLLALATNQSPTPSPSNRGSRKQ
tara:strand:- start:4836 stop:5408 length:573 start_codon:yes stop_codon:yes gene_type:complete